MGIVEEGIALYKKVTGDGPSPITWSDHGEWYDVVINNFVVASLEKRPHYCDRGHYYVKCYLPDIDSADSFPRYYMSKDVAKTETEAFLKWRIWKIRDRAHAKKESNKEQDSQKTEGSE